MASSTASSSAIVAELLMRYEVDPRRAANISKNELRNVPLEKIKKYFDAIKKPHRRFCPFLKPADFIRFREAQGAVKDKKADDGKVVKEYFRSTWPTLYEQPDQWLSAPREMMADAAAQGAALCVNADGKFAICRAGYLAVSHAWLEGLQRDPKQNGVLKSKIDLIFWSLRRQNIHNEWVWVDVLAVPGSVSKDSPVQDDILKTNIINSLADLYRNADAVIIFDSLTWQLESSDLYNTAAVLVCGAWASRLWTFQEIRLARRAYIITSGPKGNLPPEWSAIIEMLEPLQLRNPSVHRSLWLDYKILFSATNDLPKIQDVVGRCQTRETGNDVDHARAFFPTLGLKWRVGMTRDEGMEDIYTSQMVESTRMMFYFGVPRLSRFPGWVPSKLTGLEGETSAALKLEGRGIRGELAIAKVTGIESRFKRNGRTVLNCTSGESNFQCIVSELESTAAIEMIDTAIESGRLYFLRPVTELTQEYDKEYARVGLFAVQDETHEDDGFECAILCAVLFHSSSPIALELKEVFIRKHSAENHLDNALQYMWYRQDENAVAQSKSRRPKTDSNESAAPQPEVVEVLEAGEEPIHRAVRRNDLDSVQTLIMDGADPHKHDGTGLSALHIAASRGYTSIFACLLSLPSTNPRLPTETYTKETPLTLAAQSNQTEIISELLSHGIDIDERNGNNYTPLMVASLEGSLDAAELLLSLDADPNANGSGKVMRETPLKLTCGRTHPHDKRLALARALLDAGALPNGMAKPSSPSEEFTEETTSPHIYPILTTAIEYSSTPVIQLLLERGASPNTKFKYPGFCPLKIAISKSRTDVVRLLLSAGARPDTVLDDNWNLLHYAAACPDHAVMQMILERLNTDQVMWLMQMDNSNGQKPAQVAQDRGHAIVAKMLGEAFLKGFQDRLLRNLMKDAGKSNGTGGSATASTA